MKKVRDCLVLMRLLHPHREAEEARGRLSADIRRADKAADAMTANKEALKHTVRAADNISAAVAALLRGSR